MRRFSNWILTRPNRSTRSSFELGYPSEILLYTQISLVEALVIGRVKI